MQLMMQACPDVMELHREAHAAVKVMWYFAGHWSLHSHEPRQSSQVLPLACLGLCIDKYVGPFSIGEGLHDSHHDWYHGLRSNS